MVAQLDAAALETGEFLLRCCTCSQAQHHARPLTRTHAIDGRSTDYSHHGCCTCFGCYFGVNSWSGSIEIGVTALDPSTLDFPSSATGLKGGSWIISGCSVLRDGRSVLEEYGQDLDQLSEGDKVGIQRTAGGELHLWVNGRDCGVAASGLPPRVWGVVDLYGKCTQVTVLGCDTISRREETHRATATTTTTTDEGERFALYARYFQQRSGPFGLSAGVSAHHDPRADCFSRKCFVSLL
eukprot:g46769.t1